MDAVLGILASVGHAIDQVCFTSKAITGFSDCSPSAIFSTFTTAAFTPGSMRSSAGSMKSANALRSNIEPTRRV